MVLNIMILFYLVALPDSTRRTPTVGCTNVLWLIVFLFRCHLMWIISKICRLCCQKVVFGKSYVIAKSWLEYSKCCYRI